MRGLGVRLRCWGVVDANVRQEYLGTLPFMVAKYQANYGTADVRHLPTLPTYYLSRTLATA